MKKRWGILLLAFCLLGLTACAAGKLDTEKIRDIEFTVLSKEELPEEFMTQIEEEKSGQMKLNYGDKGYLYIARGYGTKTTTGYSVEVFQCYETGNSVVIKTGLQGPGKKEEILKKKTYPYVVIKMEYTDKQVVFK